MDHRGSALMPRLGSGFDIAIDVGRAPYLGQSGLPRTATSAQQIAAHGRRLAWYATALGRRIGLPEADLETLHVGSLLHDVGKHVMPRDLLQKTLPLSAAEFEIIKQHTIVGDAMCATIPALARVRPIVRHHHERLDGSGYPDGLGAGELPLLVQIVGIADVYDALAHARSYKPALETATACAMLAVEADRGWRAPDLVAEFINVVRTSPMPPDLVTSAGTAGRPLPGIPSRVYRHQPPAFVNTADGSFFATSTIA